VVSKVTFLQMLTIAAENSLANHSPARRSPSNPVGDWTNNE
jgi:hypothetical protein